jgi:hypothetical protein
MIRLVIHFFQLFMAALGKLLQCSLDLLFGILVKKRFNMKTGKKKPNDIMS